MRLGSFLPGGALLRVNPMMGESLGEESSPLFTATEHLWFGESPEGTVADLFLLTAFE